MSISDASYVSSSESEAAETEVEHALTLRNLPTSFVVFVSMVHPPLQMVSDGAIYVQYRLKISEP